MFTVVGAGLAGLTAARLLTDAGEEVRVFERRDYIGGNCAEGHGAHIFHTSNKDVWAFVQRFADWRPTRHQVWADTRDGLFCVPCTEDFADEKIIDLFFDGYSHKMWGVRWAGLPSAVRDRVKLRGNSNRYFSDTYEGVPTGGWNRFFNHLADGINIAISCKPDAWRSNVGTVIYTGRLDELFDKVRGELSFRSLWFQEIPQTLSCSVINECRPERPYIRTVDYRNLSGRQETVREFPAECVGDGIPYYPGFDSFLQTEYARMAREKDIIPLGRLAEYRYYDMDKVIERAMEVAG